MTKDQRAIYDKYLESLRLKLIKKYDELGLRASGDFERSLEPEVKDSAMTMWGAPHSWYMEHGRRAGGWPPRKAIEDWIDVKQGLPAIFREKKKQYAFLIARKIAQEGIKVPNEHNAGKVISAVVNDFLANDIYEMLQELGDVWLSQIRADVVGILQNNLTKAA
jgi:hypothetical protein